MKNYIYIALAAFVGALIAIFIGTLLVGNSINLGGIGITRYPNSGIAARAGYFSSTIPTSITDNTLTVTGTATLGAITATGLVNIGTATTTMTGPFVLSGAGTISGAMTFSGTTLINEAASSTLAIGSSGSIGGKNIGCQTMFDQAATSTKYYIYISSGAVVATSTQPSFCR